jgi:glycosyltransferase involved in cell wall biosynthesis
VSACYGLRAAQVSIGMPVFNKASVLHRSIDAILSQSYANLELVISDNGSTDDTETLCRRYHHLDSRIKYFRQPKNIGAIANFQFCLDNSLGEYFMWCPSDDVISQDYLKTCIASLATDVSIVLVAGLASYADKLGRIASGNCTQLTHSSGIARVLKYFRQVSDNGVFYGVYRRPALADCVLKNMMGADWLWLAEVAYLGKVRTITTISMRRDDSWSNTTPERYYAGLAHTLGARAAFTRFPRVATAVGIGVSIYSNSAVFAAIPGPKRLLLSILVMSILSFKAAYALCRRRLGRLVRAFGLRRDSLP